MQRSFQKSFVQIGWLIYLLALCYIGRILWEKTYLTWTHGPQMIGFTLIHAYPLLFIVGVIGYLSCLAWILTASVILIRRREFIVRADLIQYCVITFTVILDQVSDKNWQWLIGLFITHH